MSLLADSQTSLQFKVHRRTPELVAPAKPTPHEFKPLSDLESLYSYRVHVPGLLIYPPNPSKNGIDPVAVIRKAVSDTLVFYYPYAGRLREGPSGKLIVECTGEGVLFTEADADVSLDQFGYPIAPPFPCFEELLFDVPGSSEILNCPLLLIQVTRLKCGGFIFGLRYNHAMGDAPGLVQFVSAIGEMARGATSPSVFPVWERHVLNYNIPQQSTSLLPKNNTDITDSDKDTKFPNELDMSYRVFFFGPTEISALRRHLPPHLQRCTSFEITTASVWKCRVLALQPRPTEEMSLIWSVNLRSKLKHLFPKGYYGNAVVPSTSTSTAKELMEKPLSYALQLVKKSKEEKAIEDYIRTITNLKVNIWCYSVTDLRYAGFEKVDFGWGDALFGGTVICSPIIGNYFPFKNKNGENGMMLPMCLPKQAMERFEKELKSMLKNYSGDDNTVKSKL